MTTATLPRQLSLGDIVVNIDPELKEHNRRYGRPPYRGIVTYALGNGEPKSVPIETNYQIRISAGHYSSCNTADDWQLVPEEAWTVEERTRRAALRYEAPGWPQEGPLSDGDTFEWQVLAEMLPAELRQRITEGDWPSTEDLFYLLAGYIDRLQKSGTGI